jgi:hypothetical protein
MAQMFVQTSPDDLQLPFQITIPRKRLLPGLAMPNNPLTTAQ